MARPKNTEPTKQYNITLDPRVVEESREHFKKYGGRLAPLLNNLLTEWVLDQREVAELIKQSFKKKTPASELIEQSIKEEDKEADTDSKES